MKRFACALILVLGTTGCQPDVSNDPAVVACEAFVKSGIAENRRYERVSATLAGWSVNLEYRTLDVPAKQQASCKFILEGDKFHLSQDFVPAKVHEECEKNKTTADSPELRFKVSMAATGSMGSDYRDSVMKEISLLQKELKRCQQLIAAEALVKMRLLTNGIGTSLPIRSIHRPQNGVRTEFLNLVFSPPRPLLPRHAQACVVRPPA